MNELLEQLQIKMEAFQKDAALQAEKGNKAAGQRARCVSLEMKAYQQESPEQVQLPQLTHTEAELIREEMRQKGMVY